LEFCPLIIGFVSHLKLHLDAKACKVRYRSEGEKKVSASLMQ
jgi:hypothetical protein